MPEVAGLGPDHRVVVAQLGHGASLCAMRDGRSVATTMAFTTMDGLVMGKRSGALDPGVVLHLMREKGLSIIEVDELLNQRSGLLGVSGLSDDVRDLEASDDPNAAEALDLFAYRAAREVGSLVAALGGLDALVFTAGIGEHSASMGRASAGFPPGPGSSWTTLPTPHTGRASPPRHPASAPSSFRPTRRS